jgi:hypothetical protein
VSEPGVKPEGGKLVLFENRNSGVAAKLRIIDWVLYIITRLRSVIFMEWKKLTSTHRVIQLFFILSMDSEKVEFLFRLFFNIQKNPVEYRIRNHSIPVGIN